MKRFEIYKPVVVYTNHTEQKFAYVKTDEILSEDYRTTHAYRVSHGDMWDMDFEIWIY